MPLAKLVTACLELTDQLSGCLGDGCDIECFECFDDQISLTDHVIILDSEQVNIIGRDVVEKEILRYESAGVSVFLAWSDTAQDFRALAMDLGCSDYLAPPFIESVVNSKCKTHISLANLKRDFADNATNSLSDTAAGSASGFVKAKELLAVQDAAILCLATIARVRDHSTGNHILRTQHYVKALAEHLRKSAEYGEELDSETIELFYKTSALHDIGKVGIPDSILQKPGALMPDEYEVMKTHTYLGYQAVHSAAQLLERESSGQAAKFLKIAQQVTLSHHERWDGKGYPQGLEGKKIPLVARLMAVADVYDAMISRRPYKNAMDHSYVTQVISRGKGSHFDPTVVDAFLDLQDMFDRISIKLEDVFPSSVDMTLHSIADLIDENDVVVSPTI